MHRAMIVPSRASSEIQTHVRGSQRVQHARRGFARPAAPFGDVLAEEDEQGRHDAAGQQVVLRNTEVVDLRQPDQGPVAEEHRQHDVDPLREGEHQPHGEDRHRAGHHRRGHHRERAAEQQRDRRVDEWHEHERQGEVRMVPRAGERGVACGEVVDPDAAHDGPEERQHVVVLPLSAVDEVVDARDPEVEPRHVELHGDAHAARGAQSQQDDEQGAGQRPDDLHGPGSLVVGCYRIPEGLHGGVSGRGRGGGVA